MIPVLAVLFAGAVLAHFLPRLSRPGLFFAVTVDSGFAATAEARRIITGYRSIFWLAFAAATSAILVSGRALAALIYIIGLLLAVAVSHRRSLRYRTPSNTMVEADLAAPRESLPGGWIMALAPFTLMASLAIWASQHWDQLPERMPAHWGPHGPDRWVMRTPSGVYGMLAVDAVISLCFVLMAIGILHSSRRVSVRPRFRSFNAQFFVLLAFFPALQAWANLVRPSSGVWLLEPFLAVAAAYNFLLIWERPHIASRGGDYTPDACWKLGVFYYNPVDPAIFVVKRFGLGYAPNWGNRWIWAGLGLILATIAMRVISR